MGIALLLLIALVVWGYLKAREQRLEAAKRQKKIEEQYEELRTREQRLEADKEEVERRVKIQQQYEEQRAREQRLEPATSNRNHNRESLNTGISELDGPGMFYRLTRFEPSGSAVYLLHSEKHNAYKVGYCDPRGIANRIKQIKPEVPDVKLVGTAVFTSNQKAFKAEQEILEKYSSHKYSGIHGRWSGSTEWITQRPTGRPFLTKPSSVEEKYQEALEAPEVRPIEDDNYTVYLMKSPSKVMHRVSWCKTENLSEKLRKARNEFADDVKIISRFPIQTKDKARAVAIDINKKAVTLITDGTKMSFEWASNPSYLSKFRDWDKDGKKII